MSVGGAGDDESNDVFLAPAAFSELDCEPVEQVAVEGSFTLNTKVFGCFDESGTEQGLPDAVDLDARGERVVGLEKPAGEAEPVCGGAFGRRGKEAGGGECDFVLGFEVFAAVEQERVAGFVVAHHHDARNLFFLDALDSGGEFGGLFCVGIVGTDFGPDGVIEESAQTLFELRLLLGSALVGFNAEDGGEGRREELSVGSARVFSFGGDVAGPCGEGEVPFFFEESVGLGLGALLCEGFDFCVLLGLSEFEEGRGNPHGAGSASGESAF